MSDEVTFKKHCDDTPNFAHYIRNTYEAVKVLKSAAAKNGEVLRQKDVIAKAETINELYWGKRDLLHRRRISAFLIDVKFPQAVTDILLQLKSSCPEYLIFDREKPRKPKQLKKDPEAIKKAQDIAIQLLSSCRGFTETGDDFCISIGETGIVPVLNVMIEKLKDCTADMLKDVDPKTQALVRKTPRGLMLARSLDILHHLARRHACRKHFTNYRLIIDTLLPITKDEISDFASKALLTLAYIVDEENNDIIMANQEPIKLLIYLNTKAVGKPDRRHLGFTTNQLAKGLAQIAVNDNNKRIIGENGAIPVLINMITSAKDDEEKENAALALWTLAFDNNNKEIIKKSPGAMDVLRKLSKSKNPQVKTAASGALWEVEGKQAHATKLVVEKKEKKTEAEEKKDETDDVYEVESLASTSTKPEGKHVMISYQWDVQSTLIKVKNKLKAAGYNIWMDLEKMGGSTLESMADAVENAAVVLMCVSQKYKESANCRSEAEYAFQLRKNIVPLIMEANYRADGWLGMIMGSKLWIDFSEKRNLNESVEKLKKELDMNKSVVAVTKVSDGVESATPVPERPDISNWTPDDAAKWMDNIGLSGDPKAMQRLTGKILHQLEDLRIESPEFFYNSLKTDLGLGNIFDVLKFAEELRELVS